VGKVRLYNDGGTKDVKFVMLVKRKVRKVVASVHEAKHQMPNCL
jgi:hypothetical protein